MLRPMLRSSLRAIQRATLGAGDDAALTLVAPGALVAPLVLTRTQAAGVQSTGLTAAGWQTYGADVPRFVVPNSGLLIGGQRTNSVPNPRADGAAAGTPGTAPTGWGLSGTANGVTFRFAGVGVEQGIAYVDVEVGGTATAASGGFLYFNANTGIIAAASGQTWTRSVFLSLIAGSLPAGAVINLFSRFADTGGASTTDTLSTTVTVGTGALAGQRYSHTRTTADATTAWLGGGVRFDNIPVGPVAFTLRIGWPQVELGGFASTPILPPVGSPGASTRGGDIVTAPLSSLGIGGNGACTVLWRGEVPQAAGSVGQAILCIDDGGPANRFFVDNPAGGASVAVNRVASGVGFNSIFGTMTPGTVFRLGMCIDGAGRAAVSFNGAAAFAITGGPTAGLTTFRLGNTNSGNPAMFGTTERLQVLPYTIPDAALQAAVAAF